MDEAEFATIEIVERTVMAVDDVAGIVPNEVLLNGRPVHTAADRPVVIHETTVGQDLVAVTLTLLAKRVVIEPRPR